MDTSRISWRVFALVCALVLAISACGTNDQAAGRLRLTPPPATDTRRAPLRPPVRPPP